MSLKKKNKTQKTLFCYPGMRSDFLGEQGFPHACGVMSGRCSTQLPPSRAPQPLVGSAAGSPCHCGRLGRGVHITELCLLLRMFVCVQRLPLINNLTHSMDFSSACLWNNLSNYPHHHNNDNTKNHHKCWLCQSSRTQVTQVTFSPYEVGVLLSTSRTTHWPQEPWVWALNCGQNWGTGMTWGYFYKSS